MRAPSSFGNNLPAIEDHSLGSNSSTTGGTPIAHNSTNNVHTTSVTNHNGGSLNQPRMKRSNYLSVMASSTQESEDLVALLSRPATGGGGLRRSLNDDQGGHEDEVSSAQEELSQGGSQTNPSPGAGRSTFFDLRRPMEQQAPSSSSHVHFGGGGTQQLQRPLAPSLKSSLRMGSRSDIKASQAPVTQSEMRKNTSVTFAGSTKQASQAAEQQQRGNAGFSFPAVPQQQQTRVGFQQVAQMRQFPQQQNAYSKESMMKKSQSIAAPQFMLAHQNSVSSSVQSANESFHSQGEPVGGGGGGGSDEEAAGNSSFPIYFADLPPSGNQPQQQRKRPSPFQQASMRSKSTNTMQYYAKNTMQSDIAKDPAQKLLHAAGMAGLPSTARPSMNGLNLTFRDMLDEGDGVENDNNLRSRNQQWKKFQSFSNKFESDNPMMQATMMEMDRTSGSAPINPIKEGGSFGSMGTTDTEGTTPISLSESKRTLTPSSFTSQDSSGATGNKAFSNGNGMMPPQRSLAGSHRAVVSVNDLAMLRRAAARMKVNPTPNSMQQSQAQRQTSQKLPGETLGGGMLSRIPSSTNTSCTGGEAAGGDVVNALSPMAQMMAKMNSGGGGSAGSGGGNPSGVNQQKELFLQMLSNRDAAGGGNNPGSQSPYGLSSHASSSNMGMGGMGRRVQTVGAGLAYGRGNMSVGKNGFRLSRFNLGGMTKEASILSQISSGGDSATGGGRNEEW